MGHQLHGRQDKLHITNELSIGPDAVLVIRDADGTETEISPRELKNLDGNTGGQELTVSGAVTAGVQSVELNHASTIIAATSADAAAHQGFFIVKNTSASGTAAHNLVLTSGTFDGTNDTATLNAPNEALVVFFDSSGNGTIVENVGAVALS